MKKIIFGIFPRKRGRETLPCRMYGWWLNMGQCWNGSW